jgi:CheY-like chemotaxis protein
MTTRTSNPKSTERVRKEAIMPKKILVIDDEPHLVKYLTIFLQDCGYETCSAADGEEAFEVLKREKPDLVTLDLQMPNETGTRFYRNMTKDKEFKDTPVIVISGIPGRHLAVSKPVAVFEKPIDREALLYAIKKTIGR